MNEGLITAAAALLAVATCTGCSSERGGDASGEQSRSPTRVTGSSASTPSQSPTPSLSGPDRAPEEAFDPVRLYPLPTYAVQRCRALQEQVSFPFLCPQRLPRPSLPQVCTSLCKLRMEAAYRVGREIWGFSFAYGAPIEPASARDWRSLLWRNRSCCQLHFEVFRRQGGVRRIPTGARPGILGGKPGLLKHATAYDTSSGPGNADIYWANHLRFMWHERGVDYVASLHSFGRGTRSLLGRLIRQLRPASDLEMG